MKPKQQISSKSFLGEAFIYFGIAIGAFLAAFSIEIFLIPNNLIDGGIVGVSMILGNITATKNIPYFLVLLNIPFLVMAYRFIGKVFLLHFTVAVILFAGSLIFIHNYVHWEFHGETLEVVVIGGAILGVGIGLIIRYGGCLDGTEILGIIISKRTGFTVGQVVLFCNVFIFGAAGLVFKDWHPPLLSLITYMVVIRVMDSVIVGLDETKSVMIISEKSKTVAEAIMKELGLGLTIMYGRGGFTGDPREIIYVIAERLQLAELKELIHREDAQAFIAIENLHEVAYGSQSLINRKKRGSSLEKLLKQITRKKRPV